MKKRKQFLPLKIVAILSILLTVLIPSMVGLSRTSAEEEPLKISTEMDLETLGVGLGIILDLDDSREIGDIITERNSSLPQPSLDSSYEEQLDAASVKRQWAITIPEGMSFDEEAQKNLLLGRDSEAEVPLYHFDEETRELLIEVEGDTQKTSILLIIDEERKYELAVSDANLPVTSNTIEFSVKGKVDPSEFIADATASTTDSTDGNYETEAQESDNISPFSADGIAPQLEFDLEFWTVQDDLYNVTQGVYIDADYNGTQLPYVNLGDVLRREYVTTNRWNNPQFISYLDITFSPEIWNQTSPYTSMSVSIGNRWSTNSYRVEGSGLIINMNQYLQTGEMLNMRFQAQLADVNTNADWYPGARYPWYGIGYTLKSDGTYGLGWLSQVHFRYNPETIQPTLANSVSSNGNALNTTSTVKPSTGSQYLSAGDTADFVVTSTVDNVTGSTTGMPANSIEYTGKVDPTVFTIPSSFSPTVRIGNTNVTATSTIDASGNIKVILPTSQTLSSTQTLTISFSLTASTTRGSDVRTSLVSNMTMKSRNGIQASATQVTTQFWYSAAPPATVTASLGNTVSSDGVELDVTSATMPTDSTKYLSPGDTANFQSKITVDNGIAGTSGLPVSNIVYTAQIDPTIFAITAGGASNANVSADIDGTSVSVTNASRLTATGLLTLNFMTTGIFAVTLTEGQTLTINFSLPTQTQNTQNVRTSVTSSATMTSATGSTVNTNNVTTDFWYGEQTPATLTASLGNLVTSNGNILDFLSSTEPTDPTQYVTPGDTVDFTGIIQATNNIEGSDSGFPVTNIVYTTQLDATLYDDFTAGDFLSKVTANVDGTNAEISSATVSADGLLTVTMASSVVLLKQKTLYINFSLKTKTTISASVRTSQVTNAVMQSSSGATVTPPTATTRFWIIVPKTSSVTVRFVNEWDSTKELTSEVKISGTVGETINIQQNFDYRVEFQWLDGLGWTLVDTPAGDTSFTFADTNADLVYTFQKATSIAVNFLESETGNALMPAISSKTIDGYVGQTINLRNQVQSEINTATNSYYSLDVSRLPAGDSSFTFADAVPNAEQTYYFLGEEITLTVYLRNYYYDDWDRYIEMFTITGPKGKTVNIEETAEFKASEDKLKSYYPIAIDVSVAQRPWNSTSYVLGSEPPSDPNPSVQYLYTISMPFSIELVNKYDNSLLETYIGGTSLEAMIGNRIAPSWDSAFMARYDYWTDPDRGGYTLSAGESLDTTYVVPDSSVNPLQISLHLEKPATLTVNFLKSGTNEVLRPPQTITGNYYGQRINLRDLAQSDIDAVIADETYVLDESRLPTNETQFYLQDPFLSGNPGDSSVTYYFNDSLYLKTAPATIEFGPQNVRNYGELTVTDFDYDTPLVVTDNRPTKNEWRLTATLTQVFTSVNTPSQTLPTALWYKNDAGEQALRLNQPIDLLANTDANKGDYNVSNVEWNTKQNGFIFKLQSNDYRELDDYNARIRYTLVDAP